MSNENYAEKLTFIGGLVRNYLENRLISSWSRLLICPDSAGWSLDADAVSLQKICQKLSVPARIGHSVKRSNACIHYLSQFVLENPETYFSDKSCRYSIAYYHGGPKDPEFKVLFDKLTLNRNRIKKLHISNSVMEGHCLEAGFSHDQIANIPIGVDTRLFMAQSPKSRSEVRKKLGIDEDMFVVGSFQKDGIGFGNGLDPKLIKGPDVFVEVLKRAKSGIPKLFALLSGPARGYVKKGLAENGIPFTNIYLKKPEDVAQLYQALDMYLVTSRIEGGPKAILESMASCVPLVTTKVGQAVDLVKHGENAYMVGVDDVDGLTEGLLEAYNNNGYFEKMKRKARKTAESEDYLAQASRWKELFFKGYVDG